MPNAPRPKIAIEVGSGTAGGGVGFAPKEISKVGRESVGSDPGRESVGSDPVYCF